MILHTLHYIHKGLQELKQTMSTETLENFNKLNKDFTWYVSGPMTNYPDFNYPLFRQVTKEMRDQGFTVIDPSENDNGSSHRGWEFYIRMDLKNLMDCHAVVVLPGWETSKGANLEVSTARALSMPIYSYPNFDLVGSSEIKVEHEPNKVTESIIDEAKRIVGGDRQNSYGHPYNDFSRTATMWSGLLSEKLAPGQTIKPEEVGMMMVLLKMSRHMNKKKRDNLTDAHGYLITVDMVENYKAE